MTANPWRGEDTLLVAGAPHTLRPSFAALVAAEEELGPLFALVERAGSGQLKLAEMATLFWHCLTDRAGLTREAVGEAVLAAGLAACARPLRTLLAQILQGAGVNPAFGPGAARLAGVAARLLGWRPAEFWAATPAELVAALAPPDDARTDPLGRDDLNRLMEREP